MDYQAAAIEILRCISTLGGGAAATRLQQCSQGEAMTLHLLALAPAGMTPGDLSEQMGISTARVAAILNGLEAKGYILRRSGPGDRRRVLVELTEAGRERGQALYRHMVNHVMSTLQLLDREEIDWCIRILHKLEAARRTQKEDRVC